MTRRKRHLTPPAEHLRLAAARHAAIATGAPHESDPAAADEGEPAPTPLQEKARHQPRNREGKFT